MQSKMENVWGMIKVGARGGSVWTPAMDLDGGRAAMPLLAAAAFIRVSEDSPSW